MGFLARLLAGLLAASTLGTGLAGTANAVDVTGAAGTTKSVVKLTAKTKTNGKIRLASDTSKLSDHLINSDFEYLPDGGWKTINARYDMASAYTSVDPNNGQYIRNTRHADSDTGTAWVDWDGFDASKFAWRTDQKGGQDQGGLKDRANAVELQQDSTDGNTYAEMVASETGRTIYQDLKTIPGTLYKIRLKHASLCKDNVDKMQVVINGTPIEMTRVAANGKACDKVGEKSTTIGTRVTNENRWHHADQWETYEGYYVIPDGQTTTRFGFKAVNYLDPTKGNLLDDVTFARAYKLSYDKNASDATGSVPSNQRGKENTVQPAESKTDGNVKTVSDDAAGRTVLECKQSGEGATGPYADKFCWIDWSNLRLDRTGEPIPVRINVPGGHIDADATITHTDNAALTTKDFTGDKWSRLIPAYRLTGNTALAFHHIQGNSADPLASVMFSNITPVANQTAASVNVLKDFQLAFGDAETMSGYVVNDRKTYEQTDIESDKTLDKLGMIGDDNPNQSYSEANIGYGTTHVTLAGGPAGKHAPFTDDSNSKGAAVIGATQPTRFEVSFKQVNHPVNNAWSAIAVGVYMPYLTAYPLIYDKNSSNATGEVPSNQRGKENTTQPAASKTNGTVKTVADDTSNLPDHLVNGDFEYPGANVLSKNRYDEKDYNWWGVSRKDKMVYDPSHETQWVSLPSTFDSDRFAWDSTEVARVQNRSSQWHTNEVELQRDSRTGNMYAELCAYQAHTSIRQYIHTTPGTLYKVRLKHASLSRDYLDKMQVLVGPAGNEQPVRMTRVESQNGLDATGESTASTTVSTHASNGMEIKDGQGTPYSSRNHNGQWATYEGVYVATSDVTSFTFKSVDAKAYNLGNLLDDIVFDKAYRLSYDKNSTAASGQVPSNERGRENTVQPAKAKTTGSVRLAADKTASGLTVHDLEMNDIPADYRQFILNTTDTRLSQVEFENGAWYKSTDSSSQGMWPLKAGASLTIPSVGDWTDPSGRTHQISMTMRLKDWNGGSVSELYRFDGHGNIVGDGRFWINTAYGSGYSSLPAKVEQAMGGVDTSKRVGCSWTVEFTYADTGEKVPDTFKGVTGFNDLDGWDAQSDLKFEGVQLLSGFDGAYKRSDAELGTYGTNGFAGIGHDAGDEAHLNAPQQSRHRLAATWTGSTFTFSYDLSNPAGRTDGSRMTFGAPVTRTAVLTYDKNAADASGQVPSNTTPDTTQTASSKSTGKVSDLVQRTTTHEDGSVTVKTIDTSTDVVSGCQVYYPAGQRITLATMAQDDDCWDSSMLTRPGHTQLGWNQDRNATQAQAQVTMVEGGMTVYAVWVGNPVLTYDTNKPSTWSGQMPSTPASVSVPYNTAAADGSGWRAGDTTKIRGYRFLGWYTGSQDNAGLYDWTRPLTGSVTVYAHWQRLQANVIYNANGGTGSHPNTTGWQYSDVTIPGDTSKSFKHDGLYLFKHWNTQPNDQGTVYTDGSRIALQDKDITLYAIWVPYHEHFVPTGGIGLPIAIAGGVLLLMFGIGSTVMLTRRMNGHGMPDDE